MSDKSYSERYDECKTDEERAALVKEMEEKHPHLAWWRPENQQNVDEDEEDDYVAPADDPERIFRILRAAPLYPDICRHFGVNSIRDVEHMQSLGLDSLSSVSRLITELRSKELADRVDSFLDDAFHAFSNIFKNTARGRQSQLQSLDHQVEVAKRKAEIAKYQGSEPAAQTSQGFKEFLDHKFKTLKELNDYKEKIRRENPEMLNDPDLKSIFETQRQTILKQRHK